jgi:lipopolysaccharide transport system ATP-binding protein
MSEVAIRVRGVSKRYTIGANRADYKTLRESLVSAARTAFRLPNWGSRNGRAARFSADRTLWALKDVSFDVQHGEIVGIIGRNGAGKSTLLKILSRITDPTEGEIDIEGRVGSLLEVGTGFHPELTGRENIFLNGAILGMKRAEIDARFGEIIAFAGTEKFLDTPVKYYSSGMYMRLAFAVAAHLEPEILIIDEVLSVGDAEFQKKCLGKMGDVARSGRTVLFVSHNMTAVNALCARALWLSDGRVQLDGPVASAVNAYLSQSACAPAQGFWPDPSDAPGNDSVRIRKISIRPEPQNSVDGSDSSRITVRTPLVMEFEYWNLRPGAHLNLSICLYNGEGVLAFNSFPAVDSEWMNRPYPAGLFHTSCRIPADLLNDGSYRIHLSVVWDQTTVIFEMERALSFEVHDIRPTGIRWHGKIAGVVRPALDWQTEFIEDVEPIHANGSGYTKPL